MEGKLELWEGWRGKKPYKTTAMRSQGVLGVHKNMTGTGRFVLSANLTASRITMETNH